MKALFEVGLEKALRFLWYGMYAGLVRASFLPPLRTFLLRLAGCRIGNDTVVFSVVFANLYHYGFSKLRIGKRCFVGDEVMLDVRGGITIEDDVTVSNRTTIVSHINVGFADHPLQKHYPMKETAVVIKRGAYIGTGAIILPGVTIGEESVIGAGAVVTKDIPERTVVVGVPARKLKSLKANK